VWKLLLDNSLWAVAFGLMLASSGLDGVYMAKWMPAGFGWLGLVLNTMSDIAAITLTYWFGRLQQSGKTKRRLSLVLLGAELVAVAYSWFFSWRQLRLVLPAVEPAEWRIVSAIAAGFIPLLLAFIGYAQSLLAGRVAAEQRETAPKPQPEPFTCEVCGWIGKGQASLNAHKRVHKGAE